MPRCVWLWVKWKFLNRMRVFCRIVVKKVEAYQINSVELSQVIAFESNQFNQVVCVCGLDLNKSHLLEADAFSFAVTVLYYGLDLWSIAAVRCHFTYSSWYTVFAVAFAKNFFSSLCDVSLNFSDPFSYTINELCQMCIYNLSICGSAKKKRELCEWNTKCT